MEEEIITDYQALFKAYIEYIAFYMLLGWEDKILNFSEWRNELHLNNSR